MLEFSSGVSRKDKPESPGLVEGSCLTMRVAVSDSENVYCLHVSSCVYEELLSQTSDNGYSLEASGTLDCDVCLILFHELY